MKNLKKLIPALILVLLNAQAVFADIPSIPREDVPETGKKTFALILAAAAAVIALVIIIRIIRSKKGK